MPTIIDVSPPLNKPGGGVVFVVTERISLEPDQIVEDPPNIESDMVPPECWVRRTFPRRLVDLETFKLVTYEGAEKSSGWFWVGVVLLVVTVVATGGAGAFLWAAAGAATAATTAALTGAAALSSVIAKVTFDQGMTLVREPDDWEMTSTIVSTDGPFTRQLNERPHSARTEIEVVPCDRPITGGTEPPGGAGGTQPPGGGGGETPPGGS